jgi:cellulose synthase/poly-beta-1,6-N-acetylglucosamine synthase-like glycosyltransferase
VVHARTTGFNAARGEIIGRIDADTVIAEDWVAAARRIFSDPTVDAVSGSVQYYDVTRPRLSGRFDLFFRQWLADKLGREMFLYGANMAIRRSSWRRVKGELCHRAGLHEDFDLAIHAETLGQRVVFDKNLRAGVSLRRFESGIHNFWQYAKLSPKTYAAHGRTSQRYMYVVIVVVLTTYWFIWLHHQGYDPEREGLSWRHLRAATSTIRVNPATFVE